MVNEIKGKEDKCGFRVRKVLEGNIFREMMSKCKKGNDEDNEYKKIMLKRVPAI